MLSLVSAEVSISAPAHCTAAHRQSKSSCSLSNLLPLDPLQEFLCAHFLGPLKLSCMRMVTVVLEGCPMQAKVTWTS